jgi:hypothetical protein
MWYAWERREKCTGFWWENPKERKRPLDKAWCRWEDGIRMDLRETGQEVYSGYSWLRIGSGDEIL